MSIGALVHAHFVAAAAPPTVSTAAPVAVSTAAPIIPIVAHSTKKAPADKKWGWKEWAIMIGSILTMGAVAAVAAHNQSGNAGTGTNMNMNGM